jgi:hypothetical protein
VKFWQLNTLGRDEPGLMERLADNPEWAMYVDWDRNINRLVDEQDRDKLDAEVPDEACIHLLSASKKKYYLSGGYLRASRFSPFDRVLSAVDAFKLYGGSSLEEAREYGLVRVAPAD